MYLSSVSVKSESDEQRDKYAFDREAINMKVKQRRAQDGCPGTKSR